MGLDVAFFIPGNNEPIIHLRNHRWFFEQFTFGETVHDGYTDVFIEDWTLEGAEVRVLIEMFGRGLEPNVPLTLSGDIAWEGEDDHPWPALLHFYLKTLAKLKDANAGPDRLICAWSA